MAAAAGGSLARFKLIPFTYRVEFCDSLFYVLEKYKINEKRGFSKKLFLAKISMYLYWLNVCDDVILYAGRTCAHAQLSSSAQCDCAHKFYLQFNSDTLVHKLGMFLNKSVEITN